VRCTAASATIDGLFLGLLGERTQAIVDRGTRTGHEEVVALVERYLDQLEPRGRKRGRRARSS